jgi:hypothetical protein
MVRHHDDELFSGRQKENTGEVGMVVREEVHCDPARIRRARTLPVGIQGMQITPE